LKRAPAFLVFWVVLVLCFGLFAGRLMRAVNVSREELGLRPQGRERETVWLMRAMAALLLVIFGIALITGDLSPTPI